MATTLVAGGRGKKKTDRGGKPIKLREAYAAVSPTSAGAIIAAAHEADARDGGGDFKMQPFAMEEKEAAADAPGEFLRNYETITVPLPADVACEAVVYVVLHAGRWHWGMNATVHAEARDGGGSAGW